MQSANAVRFQGAREPAPLTLVNENGSDSNCRTFKSEPTHFPIVARFFPRASFRSERDHVHEKAGYVDRRRGIRRFAAPGSAGLGRPSARCPARGSHHACSGNRARETERARVAPGAALGVAGSPNSSSSVHRKRLRCTQRRNGQPIFSCRIRFGKIAAERKRTRQFPLRSLNLDFGGRNCFPVLMG
jgi:hypothetical protein